MIRLKKYIKYIIPSIITLIILGIIYYLNNLYPFGEKPLVQVDADYIYIPILYKIWDILHFASNIFYTKLALGNSIYGSLIIQGSLYSPLNLILYLVDRNNLINFMGVFIMIKLCLISFTSYIYINHKYHNINYFYKLLFSILYTFNGYIIFNYFNHMWLDIVILFPILVIYLDKLLDNKDIAGYIIVLSLSLIFTFYYSYFILIFILFYTFIHLHLSKKAEIKDIVFKLGKGTFIAFLISAFSSLPLIYQILTSSRFHTEVSTELFSNLPMKSLYVLYSPLMIIYFILLLTKYKSDKKHVFGYFIIVLLYLIPVIFDPINALLHGGTYWSFPYRYGFITSFILMDASLYYISNYLKEEDVKIDLIGKFSYLVIMLLLSGLIYLSLKSRANIIDKGILLGINKEKWLLLFYVAAIVVSYVFAFLINGKIYKYTAISIISLFSIFLFTSLTIYYNKGYFLTTNAKNFYDHIDIQHDGLYRVEYSGYTPYYGLMYDVDTIDSWLHIVPSHVLEAEQRLGYAYVTTRNYSYGGTIFSDYLLNVKYVISNEDKSNDDMYEELGEYDYKRLYRYNYNSSYAIPFNEIKEITYNDKFDYQNQIYQNLFNTDKNIINYGEYEVTNSDEYTFRVTKPIYLYLDADSYENFNRICMNDVCIYKDEEYIKYLGYYDSDIEIKVDTRDNTTVKYRLAAIAKEDIANLTSSSVKYENGVYYYDNVDDYQYLYFPINNIKGIKVYNNDKRVNTYKYINNFIYIKLNKGENKITIKYTQPFIKIGILLSIIGIILFIFNKKIKVHKLLLDACYYIFNFITIFLVLYFYIYAIFKYML